MEIKQKELNDTVINRPTPLLEKDSQGDIIAEEIRILDEKLKLAEERGDIKRIEKSEETLKRSVRHYNQPQKKEQTAQTTNTEEYEKHKTKRESALRKKQLKLDGVVAEKEKAMKARNVTSLHQVLDKIDELYNELQFKLHNISSDVVVVKSDVKLVKKAVEEILFLQRERKVGNTVEAEQEETTGSQEIIATKKVEEDSTSDACVGETLTPKSTLIKKQDEEISILKDDNAVLKNTNAVLKNQNSAVNELYTEACIENKKLKEESKTKLNFNAEVEEVEEKK